MRFKGRLQKSDGRVLMVSPSNGRPFFCVEEIASLLGAPQKKDLMFCSINDDCAVVNKLAGDYLIGMDLNLDATVRLNRAGVHQMIYGDVLFLNKNLIKFRYDTTKGKEDNVQPFRASHQSRNKKLQKKEAQKQ